MTTPRETVTSSTSKTPPLPGSSSSGAARSASQHSGSSHGKLPLASDFFSVPQLNSKESKYLLGLAKHACKEVVYYSREHDGPMTWLHLASEDGVKVFQGVDHATTSKPEAKALTYLRGACQIHATLDEVAEFFKLDTPEKLAGFSQSVGKDLLDQQTLLTLASPTAENPKHYVGVKWTAVESPSKLARNRDFCYVECHDEFLDTNSKRRGWVRSIHSIRLPFCPPLNKSHGLVRGSFYRSGFIFTESADGNSVDAVHTLHLDIKGNAPNWLKLLVMKRRIKNIAEVNRYFQRQRLIRGKLLGDLELPAKDGVARCQLCETRFGLFHRKRRCRKCGKVVCSPCGHDFLLDYAGAGPKKVRICLECSEAVGFGANGAMAKDVKKATKLSSSDVRPLYDESPGSSSQSQALESRQFSVEEQEYYLKNEDARGIADMEEAKRMHKEFEELLKNTTDGDTALIEGERRRPSPIQTKSLTGSASGGDTLSGDTPPGLNSELPPWEDGQPLELTATTAVYQHSLLKKSPSLGRGFGEARSESADSIRLSTEWGEDYYVGGRADRKSAMLTSFRSTGSGRSSAGSGRPRQPSIESGGATSLSSNGRELRYASQRRGEASRSSSRDSADDTRSLENDPERQRRTREYFDARNARLAQLGSRSQRNSARREYDSTPVLSRRTGDKVERMFEYERSTRSYHASGGASGSDPPLRRGLSRTDLGLTSPYTSLSDDFATRRHHQNAEDAAETEDQALRMAISAMRLYEQERGPDLQVTEATRQAALTKMMAVYAREIERSHSNDSLSRGGETHRRLQEEELRPPLRRTASEDHAASLYERQSSDYSRDDIAMPLRRPRRGNPTIYDRNPAGLYGSRASDDSHEYRDLSDLSSSAFRAFQMSSQGPRSAPKRQEAAVGRSEESSSITNSYPMEDGGKTRPVVTSFTRDSTGSTTRAVRHQAKSDATTTSGDRSAAARATYGSLASSELPPPALSRPNSMHEVAESDTFSDLDLIDLPHLMRKDDPRRASVESDQRSSVERTSFTDLQRWEEGGTREELPVDEACLQDEERRLSDLLPPGAPQPSEEDSDASSNSSSQIDWASSLSKGFPGAGAAVSTEGDTGSRYAPEYSVNPQDQVASYSDLTDSLFAAEYQTALESQRSRLSVEELRRYRKSLSELLSEYSGSERSSLPSFVDYATTQPDLEPEYLQAIDDRSNGKLTKLLDEEELPREYVVPREGARRRASTAVEMEITSTRELFL